MNVEQLIWLTIALYALYLVVVVLRSVVGVWRVARSCRWARVVLRDSGVSDSSDRHTTGVTIVVVGPLSIGALEERLSLDYPYYELVWVADLRQVQGAEQIIGRYDMAEVDFCSSEGLPCGGVERLYRSRARRYRRLVIVDSRSESPAEQYNCGAEVASFDLVLPLDNRTRLAPSSLTLMVNAALNSRRGSWIVAFAANRLGDNLLSAAEQLILFAGGGGRNERIGGRVLLPLYLLRREEIIAEGGFTEPCDPLGAIPHSFGVAADGVGAAPRRRVSQVGSSVKEPAVTLGGRLLPLILGTIGSGDVSARSLRNPISGRYYTPVWVTQIWTLWLASLLISAPIEGLPMEGLWILLLVWLAGVVRTTFGLVAAVLLSEVDGLGQRVRVGVWRVVLSPIFRIRDIILPKNFVK